jgi:hypothetical protein
MSSSPDPEYHQVCIVIGLLSDQARHDLLICGRFYPGLSDITDMCSQNQPSMPPAVSCSAYIDALYADIQDT